MNKTCNRRIYKTCRNCKNNANCRTWEDCMGWKKTKPMPSRNSIDRLVKAIRHEARDNGLWLEKETIEALNAIRKQMDNQ